MISVGAACLRPQIVYASFAGTVAGYILTLFASFNTAITNPEVVTAINNTFGTMPLEAADAGVIDQGIAAIAANTGFDMASIFSSNAAEATQVIEAAGIPGVTAVAATAGENIAAGAGACAASATGAVLPVIGGVVLPAAGAVALGVAGGVLINHIRERVLSYIQNGLPLNTDPQKMANIGLYRSVNCSGYSNYSYLIFDRNDIVLVKYKNSNGKYVGVIGGYNTNEVQLRAYGSNNSFKSGEIYNRTHENPWWAQISGTYTKLDIITEVDSYNAARDYIRYGNASNIVTTVSPDIIGSIGNQKADYDATDGAFKVPTIRPAYDYGTNVITYIPESDYNDYVQSANNNTDIGNTQPEIQGDLYDRFVNPYIKPIEDNPENPDQPGNPEKQPTVPYPDPEQYPDATPEIEQVPDADIAPENVPTPTPIEPTEQDITDVNSKLPAFNLADKFPFCLPFDIHKSLTLLKGSREAPYFVWSMPFGDAGEQTVTVDLSPWDDVAQILRTLELLLFIVGLAVATRNLLGGE